MKTKEERKVYDLAYYEANRERILARKRIYSQAHKEEKKVYDLKYGPVYNLAHPGERKAYAKAYREANPEKLKAKRLAYNLANREELKAKGAARYQAVTAEARRVLGDKCACPGCGVSESAFLTVDHIHGRPKGSKGVPVLEARASGWDKTKFQTLCWNCNMSKSARGFCPVHQKAPDTNGHRPGANTQLGLKSS